MAQPPTQPQRYAEPGVVIEAPVASYVVMAGAAAAAIELLMGLMALSTGGIVDGWWFALYALPLALLVVSAAAAARLFREAS